MLNKREKNVDGVVNQCVGSEKKKEEMYVKRR